MVIDDSHVLVESDAVRLLHAGCDGAQEILRSHVDVVPNLPAIYIDI
jgi:hypothetical protein